MIAFIAVCNPAEEKTASADGISALLGRIATTYANITDYVIVVHYEMGFGAVGGFIDDSGTVAQLHSTPSAGGLVPSVSANLPDINEVLIARSGEAFRYEIGTTHRFIWIRNERTTWRYRGDINRYTQKRSVPRPKIAGPGPGLSGHEWRYFSKFRAIGGMADRAKLLNDDVGRNSVCREPSTLIKLELPNGANGRIELLWISKESGLVCQSIVEKLLPPRNDHVQFQTTRTWWQYKQISRPIDPSLFDFRPPKRAKRVAYSKDEVH